MNDNIKKHFDKFYQRLTFLDKESGVREKRIDSAIYYKEGIQNGEIVLTNVYEENIKDDYVFFKVPGIIAQLSYGEWYNKKNESLDIYIYPDPHSEEITGKVIDLLNLINDYIENNYKEYDKKINKLIYGTDNTKNIKIKYKTENILSRDNVKHINIKGVNLTEEDITELSKYKNLRTLNITKCLIDSSSFPTGESVFVFDSILPSLKIFNNNKGFALVLSNNEIKNQELTNLNLDYNTIRLVDMKIDYELFFIMTNFRNLNVLEIEGITLSNKEIEFLRVFINARKMNILGESDSLKIIEELQSLVEFEGLLNINNQEYINYLINLENEVYEKFKEYGTDYATRVLINKKIRTLLDLKQKYLKYIIPKVSLVKWRGIIENSSDEDIKKWIEYFNKLPQKIKDKIFSEDKIEFVKTNIEDAYEILGIDLPHNKDDKEYATHLIGPYGKFLYSMKRFFNAYEIPIVGSNGKILEVVRYSEEKDVTIPEHYIENKKIRVTSYDSIFEYYYNRQESESSKINYLASLIANSEIMLKNTSYQKKIKENNQLIQELQELREKNYKYVYSYLLMSPYYEQEEIEIEFRGKMCKSYQSIPDPYIKREDFNLFGIIRRTRDINSIMRILNDQFQDEHVCEEEKRLIIAEIEEYIEDLNKIDEIQSKIIKRGTIFETYIDEKYKSIIEELTINDYKDWFIEEIELFLEKYNLSEEEKELFINYILLKQSEVYYDEEQRLDYLYNRIRILEEAYSAWTILSSLEMHECETIEEAKEKSVINEEEYQMLLEYEKVFSEHNELKKTRKERVNSRRVEAYEKMLPSIDEFTIEDLKNIKKNVVITDDYNPTFDKFVDYIYFYLYHEYPTWIRTELMKCKSIPKEYKSEITRTHQEERVVHQYSHLKIEKH